MKLVFNDKPVENVRLWEMLREGAKCDRGVVFNNKLIVKFDLDNSNNLARYMFIPDAIQNMSEAVSAFLIQISSEPINVYLGDRNNPEHNYTGSKLRYFVKVNKNNKGLEVGLKLLQGNPFYLTHYSSGTYPDDYVVVVIKGQANNRIQRYLNGELSELFKESEYLGMTVWEPLQKSYFDYNAKTNTITPNQYGARLLGLSHDFSEAHVLLNKLYPQGDAPADIVKLLHEKHGNPFKIEYLND